MALGEQDKLRSRRTSSIAVIGSGYVGLTAAVCLAELGHKVTGADLDTERVCGLNSGKTPFFEPGLEQLLVDGLAKRLTFVDSATTAVVEAEFVCLCVATPQAEDGSADLSFLEAAVRQVGPALAPGSVLITKSTVPVGTADLVRSWLGRSDVAVVSCPEFLREGSAVSDFLYPDRIVIGSSDELAARRVAHLFAGIRTEVHIVNARSAELIKYASNAFLASKLSFVNEIATLSELVGADIDEVLSAVGSDSRIGHKFLQPGPGWGGSCFPKDVAALAHLASSSGAELPLLEAIQPANNAQLDHTADRIMLELAESSRPLQETVVAAWGLTFKAETSDRRDSPALAVLARVKSRVGTLQGYDPTVHDSLPECPDLVVTPDPYGALAGADLLVVLTEWEEFENIDWRKVAGLMRTPVVFDTRRRLNEDQVVGAGLTYRSVGQ